MKNRHMVCNTLCKTVSMKEKLGLNGCVGDKENSLFAVLSKVIYSPNTKYPWWLCVTIGTWSY